MLTRQCRPDSDFSARSALSFVRRKIWHELARVGQSWKKCPPECGVGILEVIADRRDCGWGKGASA